jgi:hypothetical protein
VSDPYSTPADYDVYTLDYVQAPGISWVDSGGERAEEFQDQQVPMTTGATTLFRFEPNGEITYTHKLWLRSHFPAWESFVAMLIEGKDRRPQPRVYTIADRRLEDVQMTTVSLKSIGHRQVRRGSETLVKVTYKEVRRQKPYGGAASPRDALNPIIEGLSASSADKSARLEAMRKAARAGK